MKTEPVKAIANLFYEYTPGNGAMIGLVGQTIIDPLTRRVLKSDGRTPGGIEIKNPTLIRRPTIGRVAPMSIIQAQAVRYFRLLQDDLNQLLATQQLNEDQIENYVLREYRNLVRFMNVDVFDSQGKPHWGFLEGLEEEGFYIWFNHHVQSFQMRICGVTITFKQ